MFNPASLKGLGIAALLVVVGVAAAEASGAPEFAGIKNTLIGVFVAVLGIGLVYVGVRIGGTPLGIGLCIFGAVLILGGVLRL